MSYTKEMIHEITAAQRTYFRSGETLDADFRIRQLKKLKQAVLENEEALEQALREDLGRSRMEAYLCDLGPTIMELNEAIRGLKRWARPEKHFSGLLCFPSLVTTVYKMPYGVCLIISPFNFPVLLTLSVLTACIAGGNTAVLKTSSKSTASTRALQKLIRETFPENYVTLIDGGHETADACLAERFDKIFYTGSPEVAKHVLAAAAPNLTPTALELGGETGNWCIVRKDADIRDAARKIAFFKACNAGQICININQIAIEEEAADALLAALREEFVHQLGEHPETNPDYCHLISEGAYRKCEELCCRYRDRIVFGGTGDAESRRFSPTLIYPVGADEDLVQHELFDPLLPVIPFRGDELGKLTETIAEREHPLAMYVFTSDRKWARRFMASQQYGGGCINEVCVHMMVKGVPFNGTGHSGMGAYHGEWGFREFTHPTTVLEGSSRFNLPLREQPYSGKNEDLKMKLIRLFER